MLEKVIACQLAAYTSADSIFNNYQSGLRALHSIETAIVKVTCAVKDGSSILFLQDRSLERLYFILIYLFMYLFILLCY